MDRIPVLSMILLCLCCALSSAQRAQNVALSKTFSANSTDSSSEAERAADGFTSSSNLDCFWSEDVATPQWWEVDLGRTFPISAVTVYGDSSDYTSTLAPFNITVEGQHCATVTSMTSRDVRLACSSVLYGQRVRLTRNAPGRLKLCEFELNVPDEIGVCDLGQWGYNCQFACSADCGVGDNNTWCYKSTGECYQENVAAGKPTNQSSTFPSSDFSPSFANNGHSGDCFRSDSENNAWWEVDLGRNYFLYSMEVETGAYNELFPFQVTVDGGDCASVSYQRSDHISFHCDTVMYGQVVRLTKTASARGRLQLCEVQIKVPIGLARCPRGYHGAECQDACSNYCGGVWHPNFCYQATATCYRDCKDGIYGSECKLSCPPFCVNDTCHRDTGRCEELAPHCVGPNCEACLHGWFGEECQAKCRSSKCLLCNKTTGLCQTCLPGYNGSYCSYVPDEGAEGQTREDTKGEGDEDSDKIIAAVVPTVICVGILLAVVIVAVVCWRHRVNHKHKGNHTSAPMTSYKNGSFQAEMERNTPDNSSWEPGPVHYI